MRRIIFIILSVLFVFSVTGCGDYPGGDSSRHQAEVTLNFEGVEELVVRNITGSIEVTGWDRDAVRVIALKKAATRTLLSGLEIIPRQEGKRILVDTDYPSPCRNCGIRFQIRVPRNMEMLDLRTVTGSVHLGDLEKIMETRVKCTTGSIRGDLSGRDIHLRSVTGSIRFNIDELEDGGTVEAELTTGSVRMYLPGDFAGDLSLRTTTGRVSAEFSVDGTLSRRKNRLSGTVGSGNRTLRIRTVTGSVRILRN